MLDYAKYLVYNSYHLLTYFYNTNKLKFERDK